jgi:hypothetical protein
MVRSYPGLELCAIRLQPSSFNPAPCTFNLIPYAEHLIYYSYL